MYCTVATYCTGTLVPVGYLRLLYSRNQTYGIGYSRLLVLYHGVVQVQYDAVLYHTVK